MAEQDALNRVGSSDGAPDADEVDLIELARGLWLDKWFIGAITGLFAVLSVVFALLLPIIYEASVLLKPQNSEGGMGSLARQYGGLASLAGISLPAGDRESKTQLAIEVLKSKKFAFDFVNNHGLLPALFAADRWDWDAGTLSLDPSIFDASRGGWVRDVDPPKAAIPSPEEVHEVWSEILTVSEAKQSGFVTVSLRHPSPVFAKEWLELLVIEINQTLRSQDLAESERAVAYLEGQLKQTNVAEIRELLASLLRSHMEARMMASLEPDYAFSVIDPPTVPERKTGPSRALVTVLGTLIGGVIGVILAVIRRVWFGKGKGSAM